MLMLVSACDLFSQDAHFILNKYFETVSKGDVQKWQQIKSAYIESTSSFSNSMLNQSTPDLRETKISVHKVYRVWPDLYRADLWTDSVLTLSAFRVKSKIFVVMGNTPPFTPSVGPYEETFEFMPVTIQNIMKKSKSIKLLGFRQIEGINYYEIEILNKVLKWHLFFDENTFLLGYWNNSPDGDQSIMTKVFNYKEIDNMLFSMSELKMKNGNIFFWDEIRSLDLNKEIDPAIFEYKPR